MTFNRHRGCRTEIQFVDHEEFAEEWDVHLQRARSRYRRFRRRRTAGDRGQSSRHWLFGLPWNFSLPLQRHERIHRKSPPPNRKILDRCIVNIILILYVVLKQHWSSWLRDGNCDRSCGQDLYSVGRTTDCNVQSKEISLYLYNIARINTLFLRVFVLLICERSWPTRMWSMRWIQFSTWNPLQDFRSRLSPNTRT